MALSRNVGSIDKVVRLVVGIALLAWAVTGLGLVGVAGIAAGAIGLVLIGTGLINFCPLFKILGISSFSGNNSH